MQSRQILASQSGPARSDRLLRQRDLLFWLAASEEERAPFEDRLRKADGYKTITIMRRAFRREKQPKTAAKLTWHPLLPLPLATHMQVPIPRTMAMNVLGDLCHTLLSAANPEPSGGDDHCALRSVSCIIAEF